MLRLLLLFTIVPASELWLLFEIGGLLGGWQTFAVCVVTGIVGANLAKAQGANVLRRMQEQADRGQLPAKELLDGVLILVAGVVLLTPGFVTDALGILLLLPPTRALIRVWLRRVVTARMQRGTIQMQGHGADMGPRDGSNPFAGPFGPGAGSRARGGPQGTGPVVFHWSYDSRRGSGAAERSPPPRELDVIPPGQGQRRPPPRKAPVVFDAVLDDD